MRKKQIYLFLIFVFMFVFFSNPIVVNALNTGFSTDELTEEEKSMFISNIDLCLIESEPAKSSIVCFDVNEHEMIAVGQKSSDRKTICVYSNDGAFQYGYAFNCIGAFGVEWDEENLNIYFVRSSVVVSVTTDGYISDVHEVCNSIENNSYINHFIYATERTIGDTEYIIGNDMGILNWVASSYSQIIVRDVAGVENVIYDVSSMQLQNMILSIVIVCVFISASIVVFAWKIKTNQSGNGSAVSNHSGYDSVIDG